MEKRVYDAKEEMLGDMGVRGFALGASSAMAEEPLLASSREHYWRLWSKTASPITMDTGQWGRGLSTAGVAQQGRVGLER